MCELLVVCALLYPSLHHLSLMVLPLILILQLTMSACVNAYNSLTVRLSVCTCVCVCVCVCVCMCERGRD